MTSPHNPVELKLEEGFQLVLCLTEEGVRKAALGEQLSCWHFSVLERSERMTFSDLKEAWNGYLPLSILHPQPPLMEDVMASAMKRLQGLREDLDAKYFEARAKLTQQENDLRMIGYSATTISEGNDNAIA